MPLSAAFAAAGSGNKNSILPARRRDHPGRKPPESRLIALPFRATYAVAAFSLAALLAATSAAPAAEPLTPVGTTASDSTLDKRLQFLEDRLEGSRLHGQIWYWSWMTVDSVSAVVLGVQAGLTDHEDDAVNNGVNAGLSVIGIGDLLFRPLEARFGAEPIAGMPETTREQKIAKVRAAETLLHGNAQRADERTSLAMHAGNVGLNAAAGGIVALAGRQTDGLITFATGTLGGVINLLTAPWAPAQDWKDYEAMVGGGAGAPTRWNVALAPVADGGAHLAVLLSW